MHRVRVAVARTASGGRGAALHVGHVRLTNDSSVSRSIIHGAYQEFDRRRRRSPRSRDSESAAHRLRYARVPSRRRTEGPPRRSQRETSTTGAAGDPRAVRRGQGRRVVRRRGGSAETVPRTVALAIGARRGGFRKVIQCDAPRTIGKPSTSVGSRHPQCRRFPTPTHTTPSLGEGASGGVSRARRRLYRARLLRVRPDTRQSPAPPLPGRAARRPGITIQVLSARARRKGRPLECNSRLRNRCRSRRTVFPSGTGVRKLGRSPRGKLSRSSVRNSTRGGTRCSNR